MLTCIFQAIRLAQISPSLMPFIIPCVTYITTSTSQLCTPENLSRNGAKCSVCFGKTAKWNIYQAILVTNWLPSLMPTTLGTFTVVILFLPITFSLMALLFPGAVKSNSRLPYTPVLVRLMPYSKELTEHASYVIF
jgi:hypothetical protein